jgi:nucleotidyltransferase/DNA polymerase involved in DNA repair
VPVFGYKNHVGIDREHDFIRRYRTHAAAHDGGQLAAVPPMIEPLPLDEAYLDVTETSCLWASCAGIEARLAAER